MADLNLSFLIPLILLVVISIAEASRQVDIFALSHRVNDDVLLLHGMVFEPLVRPFLRLHLWLTACLGRLPFWDTDADPTDDTTPSFGRFNHIHGYNTFLLAVAMVLTALVRSDLTGVFLSLVVAAFWLNLPAIEVEEYDRMQVMFESGDRVDSLSVHTFAVGALCLPVVALSYVDISGAPLWMRAGGGALFILLNVVVANHYLSLLDDELSLLVARESDD